MEALSLYAKLMNEDPVYAMYAKLQSQQYYMQQPASATQQVKFRVRLQRGRDVAVEFLNETNMMDPLFIINQNKGTNYCYKNVCCS